MSSAIGAPAVDGGVENRIGEEFTSLSTSSSSEEIAARYDIGLHSNRIDFLEHVKIGLRLGITDPTTLEDLAQQTDVYADLDPSTRAISRNDQRRPYQAVAELATAVLEHPSLYHPAGVARKRFEHLRDRQIISCDATRLPLRTTTSSSTLATTRSSFVPRRRHRAAYSCLARSSHEATAQHVRHPSELF